MAGRLEGKVALITGTAGGQGRAAALRFAAEGARVMGCDLDVEGAGQTVRLVRDAGGDMHSLHPVDLTLEDDVVRLIDAAVEHFGGFDILYNNAAARRPGAIEELTLDGWNWTLAHDLTLVFLVIKHAIPVLQRYDGGAILNTASVAGINMTRPGSARGGFSHSVAKAAVIRLTEVLAIELAPYGIRVNAVSPGCILTPPVEPLVADEQARELFERAAVLGTLGDAEDVVNAAVFLVSDESRFVTGVNLAVDGGSTASGGRGAPDESAEAIIARAAERFGHR